MMPALTVEQATAAASRENFPVASWLVSRRYRAPIIAFYRFAREADDVADDPALPPADKRRAIAEMRRLIETASTGSAAAAMLGRMQRECTLDPVHSLDLLAAFAQDIETPRYDDWDDLMAYCRLSAMPVGRFVLDLHGESRALWPLNDALCAALQIINHLQDCRDDYLTLGRVYLPLAMLAQAGAEVADLAAPQASPGLRTAIAATARRTQALLTESRPFAAGIADRRLASEVAVIQALAERLAERLAREDPLARRVATSKLAAAGIAGGALLRHWAKAG